MLRCEFPGLLGNGVDVRRDLNLSESMVTGAFPTTASQSRTAAIWLCESQVGGRLLCVDTVIKPGDGRGDPGRPHQGRGHRPAHPRLHRRRRGAAARRPDRRVDRPHRRPPRRRERCGPGRGRRRHRRQRLPDRPTGWAGPAGRRRDPPQLRTSRRPGHRPRRDGHRVRPVPGPQLRGPRRAGIRHRRFPAVNGRRPPPRAPAGSTAASTSHSPPSAGSPPAPTAGSTRPATPRSTSPTPSSDPTCAWRPASVCGARSG